MPTLVEIFRKLNIVLYQNENLDLDHYYQEPYQDEGDEITMGDDPFETDKSKKKRVIDREEGDLDFSLFSYFMDGSRRTYKIGDLVIDGKKIYPVVVAQVRAGCTKRDQERRIKSYQEVSKKNLILVTDRINNVDFMEIRARIVRTELSKKFDIDVINYHHDPQRENTPENAAIGKANSVMHGMEISLLSQMVNSKMLTPKEMLIVDGPLQFLKEDTGKEEFADLFYNVVGVSKSFNPMLPTSSNKRARSQIGAELLKLNYGERTPVFKKINGRSRTFGCWYLRIRPRDRMANPLQGIIKIEKMANADDIAIEGLRSDVVDNISLSILNEGVPTCYGRDERWASHLYPIYMTETMVKASFDSDLLFMNRFKSNFK